MQSSAYHHISCEFEHCSWWGVHGTTLCDKVCQWVVTGWQLSPGTPVSSTNKTDHHDITEILLKVALNIINRKLCILCKNSSQKKIQNWKYTFYLKNLILECQTQL